MLHSEEAYHSASAGNQATPSRRVPAKGGNNCGIQRARVIGCRHSQQTMGHFCLQVVACSKMQAPAVWTASRAQRTLPKRGRNDVDIFSLPEQITGSYGGKLLAPLLGHCPQDSMLKRCSIMYQPGIVPC